MSELTTPVATVPGIEAMGLKRAFGEVKAVDGITFTAPAGAVTALIGPNGSGKTTLLLLLSGLLKPDAGKAIIAGHDVADHNLEARSKVGWMPDSIGTWDALTCTEILTAFAHAYGIPRSASAAVVADLLHRVHLAEFAQSPARVLSRGQKQRLSLARALVHDPAVLLLDEPASGLDLASRLRFQQLLKDARARGVAICLIEHNLDVVTELADRIAFLERGRVLAEGEPQAILSNPELAAIYFGAPPEAAA